MRRERGLQLYLAAYMAKSKIFREGRLLWPASTRMSIPRFANQGQIIRFKPTSNLQDSAKKTSRFIRMRQ
jgi:hypothetical protein